MQQTNNDKQRGDDGRRRAGGRILIALGIAIALGAVLGFAGADYVFAGGAGERDDKTQSASGEAAASAPSVPNSQVRARANERAQPKESERAAGEKGTESARVKEDESRRARAEAQPELDHGWAAVRDHGQSITHIVHLPPRGIGGEGRVSLGVARLAAGTPQTADRVAAWETGGNTSRMAVVMQEGEGQKSTRIRRVMGLSASPMGNRAWEYPPGKMEVLASLPGGLELMGVAGTDVGPVVLARARKSGASASSAAASSASAEGDASAEAGTNRLMCLVQNEWVEVELPLDARERSAWVVRWGEGSGALGRDKGSVAVLVPPREVKVESGERTGTLWIGRLRAVRGARVEGNEEGADRFSKARVTAAWTSRSVPWPENFVLEASTEERGHAEPDMVLVVDEAGGGFAPTDDTGLVSGRERLIALTWEDAGKRALSMVELREQGSVRIGRVEGVAREASVTAVGRAGGGSGLAFLWMGTASGAEASAAKSGEKGAEKGAEIGAGNAGATAGGAKKSGSSSPRLMVCEVALNGQEVFRGPALLADGRFKREVESLAVLLLMVMVAVVLFVVRGDAQARLALPDGYELADPMRRLMGAVIDYLPAALLASWLRGTPLGQTLMPVPFVNTGYDPGAILLAMGIAWVHTTAFEWMIGRSIGKVLTGTRVMSVSAPAGKEKGRVVRGSGDAEGDVAGEDGAGASAAMSARGARAETLGVTDRVGLWACAVRNFVRWVAPVLGMFVLVDPSRRHPGDMAARTVVVQPKVEEEAGRDEE